jgi:hypothetical protein
MATFTVQQASQKKTLDGKHGPMQVIALILQEYGIAETTAAEWYTRADTALPQPGSTLEGELSPSEYGLKFKKAQPAGGFGGGRGGRSPEETRSIVRQHSQMVALQYAAIRQAQGKLPPEDFTLEKLAIIISWFDRDALEGWKS